MSEEQQESTGSSLKKTILGTIAFLVTKGLVHESSSLLSDTALPSTSGKCSSKADSFCPFGPNREVEDRPSLTENVSLLFFCYF